LFLPDDLELDRRLYFGSMLALSDRDMLKDLDLDRRRNEKCCFFEMSEYFIFDA
jgi:hypothetical protein